MHGQLKPKQQTWDDDDLALIQELASAEARESFWAYRQLVHKDFVTGWWIKEVSECFQDFYNDLVAGLRPKLILMSPPQHGKSHSVTDFISWVSGQNPDIKSMFISYSEDLGIRANLTLQRLLSSQAYSLVFPDTAISSDSVVSQIGRPQRNSFLLEFVGYDGSFRNTTIGGQITGQALDLGIIDDPIKGRKEANSDVIRNATWECLTDDFFTRFSEYAGFLMTLTRWHIDDPAARFLEKFPETKVLRYPALAEEDEDNRSKGEALFPEFKSRDFILERQRLMAQASFEAVYQQNPYLVGGGMFPIENFILIDHLNPQLVRKTVRAWDKAGTDADDGAVAYTAGVRMHLMKPGVEPNLVVSDVVRGQWSALEREKRMRQTAQLDQQKFGYGKVLQLVEQEPGSGGKESAERTVRTTFKGHSAIAERVTGDKIIRAEPYAAQVEASNVALVSGEWVQPFLNEHELFPNGRTKDQVDSAGAAFARLVSGRYDSSLAWVTG